MIVNLFKWAERNNLFFVYKESQTAKNCLDKMTTRFSLHPESAWHYTLVNLVDLNSDAEGYLTTSIDVLRFLMKIVHSQFDLYSISSLPNPIMEQKLLNEYNNTHTILGVKLPTDLSEK